MDGVVGRAELVEAEAAVDRPALDLPLILHVGAERLEVERRGVRRRVEGDLVGDAVQRAVVHVADREDGRVLGELPLIGDPGLEAVRSR